MEAETPSEVTVELRGVRAGDEQARNRVLALVYKDLHRVAVRLLGRERPDPWLTPTTIVHETVIRLLDDAALVESPDRRRLLVAAARVMRHVLVDHARRRTAGRRGGGWTKISLEQAADRLDRNRVDVLAVHEALKALAVRSKRQAQIMQLRYFGGLTVPEAAASLKVSVVTVEREWRLARDWLRRKLND